MQPDRPGLTQALLKWSFLCFLMGFAIPVLVMGTTISLRVRKSGDKFNGTDGLIAFALASFVLGAIFLFHQAVLLGAVVLRRRASPPKTDLAGDLIAAVTGADLISLLLLFAVLVLRGEKCARCCPSFACPSWTSRDTCPL
jgi:hypothetical protein